MGFQARPRTLLWLLPAAIGLAMACGGGGGGGTSVNQPVPTLASFSPASAHAGDSVTLTGSGLLGASRVAFGGVPGAFSVLDQGAQISATVPAAGLSGTISVTTAAGTAYSPGIFGVLPSLTSVSPSHGQAGDTVTLGGTCLGDQVVITFDGVRATQQVSHSATQIRVLVPQAAATGPVVVSNGWGSATSSSDFTIDPAITAFYPTQGPTGMAVPVIIKGSGFDATCRVVLGAGPTLTPSASSATELTVAIPADASSGTFTVLKGTASVTSAASFTRNSASSSLDLFVDGWYLTQSVQDYTGTVPLVANRDGLLRVFVRANGTNAAQPQVRVTLSGGAPTDIPAPSSAVPVTMDEGTLGTSWNLPVSGALIQPGMTIALQILPGATAQADTTDDALPTPATPAVNAVKPFNAVLVPVYQVQNGSTGYVTDGSRSLDDWLDRFQRMYPVQNLGTEVHASLGSTYFYTGPALTADGSNWEALLLDIEAKRTAEGSSAYYYGVVAVPYSSGVAGLGLLGTPVAVGWDKTGYLDGGNYPEVYAHEVGHNLGHLHAPCPAPPSDSAPGNIDPDYPYAGGSIGVWGWDVGSPTSLRSPGNYWDIMSYCSPLWISDYTYRNTLAFRAASAIGDVVGAAPRDCLLVTGRVKDGQVRLDPAFMVNTVPRVPASGSHLLQIQDAQGNTLREIPFEPAEVTDLPGTPSGHFVLAVPLGAAETSAMAALRVRLGGVTKAVRRPTAAAALGFAAREPVSVRMRPGQAHVSWDAMMHPRAMIRDPRTGEVLAFAEGGSVDVGTDAGTLDVTFSDGVHSVRKLLPVQ